VQRRSVLGALIPGLLASPSVSSEIPQHFVRITFPHGVAVDVPRHWIVLDGRRQLSVETAISATMALLGVASQRSEGLYIQNFDQRGASLAFIQLRYFPHSNVTQDDIASWSATDLRQFNIDQKAHIERILAATGMTIVSWDNIQRIITSSHLSLFYSYKRTSPTGPFNIRMLHVPRGPSTFLISVSWMDSLSIQLKPTCDWILRSLTVSR
jgi:hypothetical protein